MSQSPRDLVPIRRNREGPPLFLIYVLLLVLVLLTLA